MIFTGYLAIILIDTSMYINKIVDTLVQYKYTEAHEWLSTIQKSSWCKCDSA